MIDQRHIEMLLGANIVTSSMLNVGFGLTGAHCQLNDGRDIAIKQGNETAKLDVEAHMLTQLQTIARLPVPTIYHGAPNCLITEWISNDQKITPTCEKDLAEQLAHSHKLSGKKFGYDRPTPIGGLVQENQWYDFWIPFFTDKRLRAMTILAVKQKRLDRAKGRRLEILAAKLPALLTEPEHPTLIHGDLWQGNILVKDGQLKAVIDPAIYYAHREIELAFMTMFQTVSQQFFNVYHDIYPIEPGFHEVRKEIYLLYPTLVHLILFGNAYWPPIDQCLRRHGC